MAMFWEFFRFELRFRFKSVSTYAYFFMWLFLSFLTVASENFGFGPQNGKTLLNGPFLLTQTDIYLSFFGIIVLAAIFGTSILRDFQRDTFQILFTKPISKFAYLGGRWAGSFVTTVAIYSAMMLGPYLGTFAPWADHSRIGPNHLWWYVQPFLSFVVVQIFFLGSAFFMVAALTRRIVIVYLQGVVLFMLYLIGITAFSATRSLEHFWSGVLDPVGLLMENAIARYWSVSEQNSLLFSWDFAGYSPGVFLYNRMLWIAVGVLALFLGGMLFPLSVEALTARTQGKRAARARELESDGPVLPRSLVTARLPLVTQLFTARTGWLQYLSLARLRTRSIFREIPFWALLILMIAFAVNNGHFAGRAGGTNVWPVTFLMLQAVEGGATLFLYIVAALYAAELIWRERDTRFDGIQDALPVSELTDFLSRLTAIGVVELVLLTVSMLVGVLMQTIAGYYRFEWLQYVQELYLVVFPQVMGFAMLALLVQTLVSNKFIGHAVVIGSFVLIPVLFNFGLENTLYLPGSAPQYIYSDMNGYGHFAPALTWAILYWFSWFALGGVVAIAYARRGPEDSLRARSRLARLRLPQLRFAGVFLMLAVVGSGGWYYYNGHVLNEYLTAEDMRGRQADYERQYKKYQLLPQPKITAVDTRVDIYPERRSFDASGRYTLQNKSDQPIGEIHISDRHQSLRQLTFDRAFRQVRRGPHGEYTIYTLQQPLGPGDVLQMDFKIAHESRGFRDNNELPQFAYNGTFFDLEFFPDVGYNAGFELDDPRRRREQHLGEQEEMAPRGDPVHSKINLFSTSADWITYHTVVSTREGQIAVAAGNPVRDWTKDGRHYFEYSMGDTHVQNFHAYLSAAYRVKRGVYRGAAGPVNLEIYYDPKHSFNVDEMLECSRKGLAYFESQFSPFQFSQYRILEYPRYRTFAQSFPNTVPYSEGIGFITRIADPDKDVDLTYFVTAHELAHQWWGHQLIGGAVEGSNMMSETLAEYSAYMVMRQKFGDEYMRRVMHHFLDRYLRGRAGEVRRERPLALVQNEPYVWYEKGGQILYTLADFVGEDKVNLALRNFLLQYRYANAHNQQDAADHATGTAAEDGSYPDTRQLVDALRAVTPKDYQYLIDDGFDRIVLYDNKMVSATAKRLPDGKYEVALEVQARKFQADGNGAETPMALADYIEIGVFSGAKDHEKPLSLRREKMTAERATYRIVVDQRPTRAGIDPYNKLIDRIADDNLADVGGL